jgi:hypothetical protein
MVHQISCKPKLSWFYASSSVIFSHWTWERNTLNNNKGVTLSNSTQEPAKTFSSIKFGGVIDLQKIGITFEIPLFYNRNEEYIYASGNRFNSSIGIGDIRLGIQVKQKLLLHNFYIWVPGIYNRENNRSLFSAWHDFDLFRLGYSAQLKINKHHLQGLLDVVALDVSKKTDPWAKPGNFSISLLYAYNIKLNNILSLKPYTSLNFSHYKWIHPRYDFTVNHGLGLSYQFRNMEISFNAYTTLISLKYLNQERFPAPFSFGLGLYFGIYN